MRKSRLSWYKQSKLIELFIAGSTARTASALVGVNKTTASYYFQRLHQLIYDHSEHLELFADKLNPINGIENFWNQAKCYLRKFNGIPRDPFHLYLKECE